MRAISSRPTEAALIVIVDYGMGNLGSIRNMLKKIGVSAAISGNPEDILEAEKLILPGVGAFDSGMKNLSDLGLISILERKVVAEGTPTLGICLGMQLMTRGSEEGHRDGLGWIEAQTVRFSFNPEQERLTIPHMGWNSVRPSKPSRLLCEMYENPRFYFVHSYHLKCSHDEDVLLRTKYGYEFCSGIQLNNIAGVQFHPEKSHKFGMKLLRNFAVLF